MDITTPLQAPVEHGIERGVPGTPLLIDDRPDFERPGIGGERALLIANLRGQAQTHREMPTFRGADAWTDMVPHPLPARLRLNAGEDVEACLKPRREPMRDFDGLMHRMLRGEDAILSGRGPLERAVTMELEHGRARC